MTVRERVTALEKEVMELQKKNANCEANKKIIQSDATLENHWFHSINDIMENIERQLKKIETIADDAYIKAAMSQCLVVVKKVSEDNLKKMDDILD